MQREFGGLGVFWGGINRGEEESKEVKVAVLTVAWWKNLEKSGGSFLADRGREMGARPEGRTGKVEEKKIASPWEPFKKSFNCKVKGDRKT